VVGASAGGVEALVQLVAGLPTDFPGVVLVVQHLPAGVSDVLPDILSWAGPLPVSSAVDGAVIEAGHVYVAPPDGTHLILRPGEMHLVSGPRENGVCPAADPLFRSAASAYGPRVVGVVLSGTGEDGTEGLRAIKAAGGVAVVQDPADAEFATMPSNAIRLDDVDHVVSVTRIGPLLGNLARGAAPAEALPRADSDADRRAVPNSRARPVAAPTSCAVGSRSELANRHMACETTGTRMFRGTSRPPAEILLVEDRASDIVLTIEALREGEVRHHLSVAHNGDEALAFVYQQGAFADAPRPDLILLDLNLPGRDGRQVLSEIKQSPALRTIPVIVLTTSADERDVRSSYQLHANAYVVKPADFDRFVAIMRAIDEFWLGWVTLPRPAG
jgi:chemotaxis response regulator CheB